MSVIGFDIGGTKVKAGIFEATGEIHSIIHAPTMKTNLIEQIQEMVTQLLSKSASNIQAIGIGTAGRVDFQRGYINYATSNLPGWMGTPVKELIESAFHIPVAVDNDGNCAAIAEGKLGAAKNEQDFVCITLGTGVGAGIVAGGQLVRGIKGAAGEVGHMPIVFKGKPCNCGKYGCFEQYVSGTAIRNRLAQDDVLAKLQITPEILFSGAVQNEQTKIIIDEFVNDLAYGLEMISAVLDPAKIVIGGGMVEASELWWSSLKTHNTFTSEMAIEKARLGNNAGMLGAGILAFEAIGVKI